METHISQKSPLPTTSFISASTSSSSSPSSSSIKIEQVLNSASIEPFPQSSAAAAAAARLSLPPTPLSPHPPPPPPPPPSPPPPPPPPLPPTSLPLTTLLIVESPGETSTQIQYRQHQSPPPLSSTLPKQSMVAAAVATQSSHVMQSFTRPIRFVANDGQPHAKRRRISAAYVTSRISPSQAKGEWKKKKAFFSFSLSAQFLTNITPPTSPPPLLVAGV